MQSLELNTETDSYKVLIGEQLTNLTNYADLSNCLALVDAAIISDWQKADLNCKTISLQAGEQLKSLENIAKLYTDFLDHQLDKSSTVIAVGGGALTDAVGFAAATFNRGIKCIAVPTTLLAQVDASIGGKNGINFSGVKNLIGTIVQPELVLCDLNFLSTLPKSAISSGMAEVIKAAIIADSTLFEVLTDRVKDIFELKADILEQIVFRAVKVKADIVAKDEYEKSERMKLNLGHTIGHALEVALNLEHGYAVALGMILESDLACRLGVSDKEIKLKISDICRSYQLPVKIEFNAEQIFDIMLHDKKRRAGTINFALPVSIGKTEIFPIKTDELKKHLSNLCFD